MGHPISIRHLMEHAPKREGLVKFLLLLIVFLVYFGYISWEYGLATGGLVTALTWSFFVLCTPVADAGFLLDFPVRLITGMRMFTCEILVWVTALGISVVTLFVSPESYDRTFLTSLFHKILTTPWPYWSIVVLCTIGTFLSVRLADEMMDVITHKERDYHHRHGFKYQMVALAAFILLVVWAYYHLIESLGVEIPGS